MGWRVLGTDPPDVAFNLYRSTARRRSRCGSTRSRSPVPRTTWTAAADLAQANAYFVRPIVFGLEEAASASFALPAAAPVQPYLRVPLQIPPGGTTPVGESVHLQRQRHQRGRPRRRRRIRAGREVGSLERQGQLAGGLHRQRLPRRLHAGRHAPLAHRPRPQHPRRRALHAVHGLRPRRRREGGGGGADRGRHGRRRGERHRRSRRRLAQHGGLRAGRARVPHRLRRRRPAPPWPPRPTSSRAAR